MIDPKIRAEAMFLVVSERTRQIEVKGYDAVNDKRHEHGELANAGAAYAEYAATSISLKSSGVTDPHPTRKLWPKCWPFDKLLFKPSPRVPKNDLVKACALMLAQLELIIQEEDESKKIEDINGHEVNIGDDVVGMRVEEGSWSNIHKFVGYSNTPRQYLLEALDGSSKRYFDKIMRADAANNFISKDGKGNEF